MICEEHPFPSHFALVAGSARAQETTLHTQSNVVLVPALARSPTGGMVYGLQAKDFMVEDDGVVEQTVDNI